MFNAIWVQPDGGVIVGAPLIESTATNASPVCTPAGLVSTMLFAPAVPFDVLV